MNLMILLSAVCYALAGACVWRFWRSRTARPYPLAREQLLLAAVLLLQAVSVWYPIVHDRVLPVGFGYALNLIVWLTVLLYWAGSFFYPLKGLQLLLFPCAALSVLLGLLLPGQPGGYPLQNVPFMLHVSAALLAYGLFGITMLLAVLMLVQDYCLHKRRASAMIDFLPPLLSMEKLMFQGIAAGFVLLTVAVVSGTVFAETVFGKPAGLTHKTVFGILSWLIYAVLLFEHYVRGRRGRTTARWVIVAFVCLMLAYIGSKFVLEIVLHRTY